MEKVFSPLSDEDILFLFNGNTYIVWRFKELISKEICGKFYKQFNCGSKILDSFKEVNFDNNSIIMPTQNMTWHSCFKCKLLKIGSTGWQSGELRIKADAKFSAIQDKIRPKVRIGTKIDTEIFLDFCYDQTIEYKSPLDDLRENIKA
jgi:hypothetical protein